MIRLTELVTSLCDKGLEMEGDDPDPPVVIFVAGDPAAGAPPRKVFVRQVVRDLAGRIIVWGEGDAPDPPLE